MPDDQRTNEIEKRIDREITGALAIAEHGRGALSVLPKNMTEVMELAKLMSISGICIRPMFRGNPGSCLAIVLQAMKWGADPFAVANKAFEVNGQLSYESQLIHAIVNASPALARRLQATFSGEGQTRQCLVVGLIRDEDEPREYQSPKLGEITPKNSPLWKSDPDQQLFYYSTRAWARRWVPEILLGIYAPEELTTIELTPAPLAPPPPRPRREDFVEHKPQPEPADEPTFAVIDLDGVETEYATANEAVMGLLLILSEAAQRGLSVLEGAWESNQPIMRFGDVAASMIETYNHLYALAKQPSVDPRPGREAAGSSLGGSDAGTPEPSPASAAMPGLPSAVGSAALDGGIERHRGDIPEMPAARQLPADLADTAAGRDAGGGASRPSPPASDPSPLASEPSQGDSYGHPPAAGYDGQDWPKSSSKPLDTAPPLTPPDDLVSRGEEAASRGMEPLQSFWQHGISALQRGSLGARGRGTGPYLEAWKKIAAEVDAARNPGAGAEPDGNSPNGGDHQVSAHSDGLPCGRTVGSIPATGATEPHGAPPPPASAGDLLNGGTERRVPRPAIEITGQSGVEAQDLGYLHPAMAAQAEPATNDRPSREIGPVLFNGKPDWRAWTIAIFLQKVCQQKTSNDLADFLGDNEAHLAAARAAGFEAEIDEAITAQWREVPA